MKSTIRTSLIAVATMLAMPFASLSTFSGVPEDGGVFKDALYWFTGASDRNGDGYLSQTPGDEMRNTLCAYDTGSPSNKAYAAAGPLKAFTIERATVMCPYAGLTVENASILRSRPGDSDPRAEGWVFVANASQRLNQNTSYTVLGRARRESGSPYYSVFACVGNIRFGVMGGEGPWIAFPGADKYIGGWTSSEEWFDFAFVMNATEQIAHVYTSRSGSIFRSDSIPYTQGYIDWTGGSDAVYLFYPNWTGPNGAFHQFAVWERALSEIEVREAFSWPQRTQKMQLGFANGSADEFASLGSPVGIADANPLSALPHTLNTTTPELTMRVPMDADHPIELDEVKEGYGAKYPARSQVVVCHFTPDSGRGELEVYANDVLVGCETSRPGLFVGYVIPATAVTDVTTLKLRWKSGGDIRLDTAYVAKNGDWQIGYCDKSCFNDGFRAAGTSDYQVGTPWSGFTRALTGPINGNETNLAIVATLAEADTRFKYRMEVRWAHMVSGVSPMNGIRVNGRVKALDEVGGSWVTTTAMIGPEDLRVGKNTFELFRGSDIGKLAGDYDQIDYVRFEPVRFIPSYGLSVCIK